MSSFKTKIKLTLTGNLNLISMVDGKANTIDEKFLEEFHNCLGNSDPENPVLLTGNNKFFSSGLDLFYAHRLTRIELQKFICNFQDLLVSIVRFPSSFTAVVEGHTIAGGLILLCACDRRFAVDGNYYLGINEHKIGFSLPPVPAGLLQFCFQSAAELLLNADGLLKLKDFANYEFFNLVPDDVENIEGYCVNNITKSGMNSDQKEIKINWLSDYLSQFNNEKMDAFLNSWFDEKTISSREKLLDKMKS